MKKFTIITLLCATLSACASLMDDSKFYDVNPNLNPHRELGTSGSFQWAWNDCAPRSHGNNEMLGCLSNYGFTFESSKNNPKTSIEDPNYPK